VITARREHAFGQTAQLTWVDRAGIWLSARQILRFVGDFAGKKVGDLGCGYHASFARTRLMLAERVVLVDLSLADDLKGDSRIHAIEGRLPAALCELPSRSLDVILIISVLEHLDHPEQVLREIYRVLSPDGVCLINVPSWRGKYWLELSAFGLGLSPAEEMDDHKRYYDVKDLWPMLVQAGFRPSAIRCFAHKFGLNTFAVCRRSA
jgi:ubiquinone/menaquinone biosynthesis C-methylase UbiE